jgi:uncharacterized protein
MKTAHTIDLFEAIRLEQPLNGELTLEQMPRVASSVLAEHSVAHWVAQGDPEVKAGGARNLYLNLSFSAAYDVRCERCLGPVRVDLQEDRQFLVVKDEATAAKLDADAEDYDVIAGSEQFDLHALVEDEILMALPPVPMHDDCERPASLADLPDDEVEEKPNPFAALSQLKGKLGPKSH